MMRIDRGKWLQFYIFHIGFWFRIMGYGLLIDGDKANPPLFSERQGLVKVWRGLGIRVKVLTPRQRKS